MIVVIQCASQKSSRAKPWESKNDVTVRFVGQSKSGESSITQCFRPDDLDEAGVSWRERLVRYNLAYLRNKNNPLDLIAAGEFYDPPIYSRLNRQFGSKNVYILSAGWGMVRATFLLPDYDITFSKSSQVNVVNRRLSNDNNWIDFNHLAEDRREGDKQFYFGGKLYLNLLYKTTMHYNGPKIIFHKGRVPQRTGYEYRSYATKTRTNWHYEAANAFCNYHAGK